MQLWNIWFRLVEVITFRVSRRRREMYCGYARLCVCLSVCVSAAACPQYCMDPDVTWRSGRGCPLVVHYWADLQSMHGLRCYGNIRQTLLKVNYFRHRYGQSKSLAACGCKALMLTRTLTDRVKSVSITMLPVTFGCHRFVNYHPAS